MLGWTRMSLQTSSESPGLSYAGLSDLTFSFPISRYRQGPEHPAFSQMIPGHNPLLARPSLLLASGNTVLSLPEIQFQFFLPGSFLGCIPGSLLFLLSPSVKLVAGGSLHLSCKLLDETLWHLFNPPSVNTVLLYTRRSPKHSWLT